MNANITFPNRHGSFNDYSMYNAMSEPDLLATLAAVRRSYVRNVRRGYRQHADRVQRPRMNALMLKLGMLRPSQYRQAARKLARAGDGQRLPGYNRAGFDTENL